MTHMPVRNDPQWEFDDLSGLVIESAIAVHRALGPGFVESIYENALVIELEARGVPFARQAGVAVLYREREVGRHRADLIVRDVILVELKAIRSRIPSEHFARAKSCMRAFELRNGLLLNFAKPTLEIRRLFP